VVLEEGVAEGKCESCYHHINVMAWHEN
jgi:hypothetical protein